MKGTHKDSRGVIKDLIVNRWFSLTYITFTKFAVRGNHYHLHTKQLDFVWGDLVVASGDKKYEKIMGFVYHSPALPHAYLALKPSKMLSFCVGKRRGEDYSKDTFKLDKPLI